MSMTDPIAAMLTNVRNAIVARKEKVQIPSSSIKLAIAKILQDEGYILSFKKTDDNKQGVIDIVLKYSSDGSPVITKIERVSKPSLRRYVGKDEIKPVIGGRGTSIISTSRGLMTGKQAKKNNVGGEVLCRIW